MSSGIQESSKQVFNWVDDSKTRFLLGKGSRISAHICKRGQYHEQEEGNQYIKVVHSGVLFYFNFKDSNLSINRTNLMPNNVPGKKI